MRLKYRIKFILTMIYIACIGLVGINLAFSVKENIVEVNSSRIIIESPKKENVSNSKDAVYDEVTKDAVPIYGEPVSPFQKLPVPNVDAPIVISPLS